MFDKAKSKKLFLESFHLENNAKLSLFAGYNMPISYSNGIISEHIQTRLKCGLFDVSHMLQISIIINDDTIRKLEKIIPLDLKNFPNGKSFYSFILNDKGGIIDDLIISKIRENNKDLFFIVLNASRRNIDIKIISDTINNNDFIKVRDNFSLFALQGPKSRSILCKLFPNIFNLKFMEICQLYFEGYKIIISCSGYTGEDGFEISISNNIVNKLIKKIMENEDVNLCGLGARDTLRIEAGLCLYGNELNENISPIEANLMWSIPKIRKKRADFIGADKIMNTNIKKNINKRIGLKSESKAILRSNFDIYNLQNELIGKVSSGSFSPTLKKPIAMGYINHNYAIINTVVNFKLREKIERAFICELPFIPHKYIK